ncbi:MAG: right-handed parallel beta-helix repeat-containing protein [Acidobacteria bacterium]|nr:right-handed parallel beta-helix repeat-containing protein [Acidobacteriota bacterium]
MPAIPQLSHGAIGISALSKQPGFVASGNRVSDNYIGIQSDGNTFIPGVTAAGVYLDGGANNNLIERNIISLIHLPIWINGSSDRNIASNNTIRNNIIGTNKAGTTRFPITAIRSGFDGNPAPSIDLFFRPKDNIIEGNIIAGTRAGGIGEFNTVSDESSQGNIMRNNRIGVGPNGENIAPVVTPDNQLNPETDQGAYAVGIFAQQDDVITGNIIGNFGLAGIYLRSWAGNPITSQTTQILNNQISNCPIGIEVSGIIRRTEIKGNQLSNCAKAGIVLCETPLDPSAIYQFPRPREETLMTQNILVSQNTFAGVGGPGIGLTPRCTDVLESGYLPNLSTTPQAGGPNLYQPSVRIESAIRQTDGTVKVTGVNPQSGTVEWYASSRAPRPTAPNTDVMAYGLGTFLMATPVAAGNFSIALPASSLAGVTALTATSTVNNQTSEFARTVGITGNDPDPDTVKPTVMVASPATGLVVESRPNAQVSVIWQSSDNIGVTGHWINLTGQRNGTGFEETLAAGLPGTATSFTLSIAENDAFSQAQITVSATDAAGNVGNGQSGIFSVVAPPPPDTVKPTVSQVTLSKAKIKRKKDPNVTIAWSSSDNIAVASHDVLYATDGANFSTTVVTGLAGTQQQFAWTVPASFAKTKVARVKVIARDAAANTGEAVSSSFVVK